jgi:hypothetical protein
MVDNQFFYNLRNKYLKVMRLLQMKKLKSMNRDFWALSCFFDAINGLLNLENYESNLAGNPKIMGNWWKDLITPGTMHCSPCNI